MYSVVLMAALTTGVDLPDLGRRGGGCCGCRGGGGHGRRGGGGCCGCYGGYGYGYGCMGYGYGHGCMGYGYGHGCMGYGMGMGYGCYGGMMMPHHHHPMPEKAPKPGEKKKSELSGPAPATIVVELPSDAKLLIDNEATASTGGSRVFQSPDLAPGKEYQYTFKAEVVRDGKPIKAEKVVTVKAGEITPLKLTLPALGVAQR